MESEQTTNGIEYDYLRIVKLNVGGTCYMTTRSTLSKYPDSALASMISPKFSPLRDDKGRIFIDRNGKLFQDVLDYLRNDKLPQNKDSLLELEYFGLILPGSVEILPMKRTLIVFVGYAYWMQGRDESLEEMLESMNKAASETHPGSRPATIGEYLSGSIYNMPTRNTSQYVVTFTGEGNCIEKQKDDGVTVIMLRGVEKAEPLNGKLSSELYYNLPTTGHPVLYGMDQRAVLCVISISI